jgi:hypothetical protein
MQLWIITKTLFRSAYFYSSAPVLTAVSKHQLIPKDMNILYLSSDQNFRYCGYIVSSRARSYTH